MAEQKVGDFLANMVAPDMQPRPAPDVPKGPENVGAAPIDVEAIKANAGAPRDVMARAEQNIDPMLVKELEVIQLKVKLAEAEEQLLVQRVQEIRRQRAELVRIQKNLIARVRGQIVVGPNGNPQATPQ